jgi:protein-S-isoprenylcysteine O-methyltransferase Ste14
MLGRALLAFLALPGVVAFLVPLGAVVLVGAAAVHPLGQVVVGLGCAALLWTVRDFLMVGRGTLAPWRPPQQLVVVGLYRVSRNPMYVAVLTILFGWAITFWSLALLGYMAVVAVAFRLRVIRAEEPALARRFGADWTNYCHRVPRWVGAIHLQPDRGA